MATDWEGYSNGSVAVSCGYIAIIATILKAFHFGNPECIAIMATKEKGYSNGSLPIGKALRVVEKSQPQTMPYDESLLTSQ